ncbi:N-formylglutamate amidohydrolase [Dinoroseobacter sp. S375]|uniref:N-formylglutamate amidohydrolase n=1 Tax=Dinoroseobacter sp. S375 TaxID=3415136 RepID=UPI003C7B8862
MNQQDHTKPDHPIAVRNAPGDSAIVVVCEHASAHIPTRFADLGLAPEVRQSHAVWDPGALAVAEGLAERLGATLVAATVSRLVYDCNRPPDAPDAMPARSEVIRVPGNEGLSDAERAERAHRYYTPFRETLREVVAGKSAPILVTMHSFTPIYHGQTRAVEIGILHDADTRLADALLEAAEGTTALQVARNEPYGPEHGVTHTLRDQALPQGHPNVMIEIRNDLLTTPEDQDKIAELLAGWLRVACARIGESPCTA